MKLAAHINYNSSQDQNKNIRSVSEVLPLLHQIRHEMLPSLKSD